MKENSIEEYVKILKRFSDENVIYGSTVGMTLEKYKDLQLSTEHILSDYKRVLKENEELLEVKVSASANNRILELEKENEELKEENEYNKILLDMNNNFTIDKKTGNYKWNVIEIQKIKDKIEYLKDYIEENSDEQGYWGNINPDVIYGQIEILEEILKESEE